MKKLQQNQKEERLERRNSLSRLLLIIFIFLSVGLKADYSFDFNESLLLAQEKNYQLQILPAREILDGQSDSFPENLAVDFLYQFNLFLEAFITEDKDKAKVYGSYASKTISKLEKLSDTLAYKKFAIADIYFFSAVLKGKQNELLSAAKDISNSYDIIQQNSISFPNFLPNNKTLGILKVYLSSVPDNYTWATKMLGFSGDLQGGMTLLKTLSKHRHDQGPIAYIAQEASYYHAFALYHVEHKPNTAWLATLQCTSDYPSNNMSAFFRSNMALKLGKNELAIKTLENRPQYEDYFPFYFLDYQLGTAKLNRQSIDAIGYLRKFSNNFKGKSYMKSCYQKMSWYYLLAGDYANFNTAKANIKKVGNLMTEDDKQAQQYADKPKPNRVLLKARLLCDGGYYTKALDVIKLTNVDHLKTQDEKAEYCYRKGKIFEYIGEIDIAIKFYEASSLYGIKSKEYYAAYSCLYIGDYYLKKGDKVIAKTYYKKALTFDENKEYRDSIEQRAKAGIKKCS